jgi:hypothetical protein
MVRFCPKDWDHPELNDWIAALDRAIEQRANAAPLGGAQPRGSSRGALGGGADPTGEFSAPS